MTFGFDGLAVRGSHSPTSPVFFTAGYFPSTTPTPTASNQPAKFESTVKWLTGASSASSGNHLRPHRPPAVAYYDLTHLR
jgi:hypothetical protein